ncbi:MAG: hypothetical protein NBV68_10720 [Erythrobacter sp.]|uniref:hypothetical protein n=1 Tax=Erythrobacter sp. TaxID=1042 RepID=UPI0025ED4C25|nr:hypothetical protein [Erythrobacter sp.]MCL9999843.1 hypothetical protein [Erythrobacter sp.]
MALLLQTAGSLVAILALAGLAWWLKLGGVPRLDSEAAVARAAGEVEDGFTPIAAACDAEGASALACDGAGRIIVIKRHGNRFAGRVLGPKASAQLGGQPGEFNLEVDPGEPRFGKVFLTLDDAQAWADAINRLNARQDA